MSSFASLSTIPNILPCSLLAFWPKTLTYLLFDISSFMLEKFIIHTMKYQHISPALPPLFPTIFQHCTPPISMSLNI